jgi:predicted dehydrogenase
MSKFIASAEAAQIAVVGCGRWGQNLVRNFSALGCLALVADGTEAGRQRARTLAPGTPITSDFGDVLRSPHIDGVVLATPAPTHATLCEQALRAGKDVLCEKPLALSYGEGLKLVELAQEAGSILMVGHLLEYHPAVQTLSDYVAAGVLGRLRYIYSNRLNLGTIRTSENILWSFAPHDLAVILRLVGRMPLEVIAAGGSYVQPNIPDITVTQLLFDNGIRAHIFVSWLHPFKEQRLVVVGEDNVASFDGVTGELHLHDQHVAFDAEHEPVSVRGNGRRVPHGDSEPLRLECEAFLDAIRTRNSPLTDGASGLRVLQILEAAQRSVMTNGRHVPLHPVWTQ